MEPTHFLPPVLALVIAGIWLGSQRQSIATLENQSSQLRKEIAARRSEGNAASNRSDAPGKASNDKRPMDWKKIAEQITESRTGDIWSEPALIHLSLQLMTM